MNHSQKEKQKSTAKVRTRPFGAVIASTVLILSLVAAVQLTNSNVAYAQTSPTVTGSCETTPLSPLYTARFLISNLDPVVRYTFEIIYLDTQVSRGDIPVGQTSFVTAYAIPKSAYQVDEPITLNLYESGNTETIATASVVCVDTIAPTVVSTKPANGATNVPIETVITATFSEPVVGVDANSFTINNGITGTVTYDSNTRTATFKPSSNLEYGTHYTVSLSSAIKDLAGNALAPTSWSFTTVAAPDTTAPVITVPPDITEVAEAGAEGAVVSFEEQVTAEDDVDGTVDVTCTPQSGSTFPIGETTVNCEATDAAGNTGTASFTVTVNPAPDTTAPVITVPQGGITAEATSAEGAVVSFEVTAQDDVDGTVTLAEDGTVTQDDVGGDITISCTPASGSTFQIGETTVNCEATDVAGYTSTKEFTVTVTNIPLTERFSNQGQCIREANTNPDSGITRQECQEAFVDEEEIEEEPEVELEGEEQLAATTETTDEGEGGTGGEEEQEQQSTLAATEEEVEEEEQLAATEEGAGEEETGGQQPSTEATEEGEAGGEEEGNNTG